MRKINCFILFFVFNFCVSQDVHFFSDVSFLLTEFIKDGQTEELELDNYQSGIPNYYSQPIMEFSQPNDNGMFNVNGNIFCNSFEGQYTIKTNYFEVSNIALTSSECETPSGQHDRYVNIIKGGTDARVNYEIDTYSERLTLWVNQNDKLVFRRMVVGVEKHQFKNTLKIFPNPAKNKLTIESSLYSITEVNIIDTQGRLVKNIKFNFKNIDTEFLKSGLYILTIKSQNNITTEKLIIE